MFFSSAKSGAFVPSPDHSASPKAQSSHMNPVVPALALVDRLKKRYRQSSPGLFVLTTGVLLLLTLPVEAQTVDLATGDHGTVNGAQFLWTRERPTGTGYIDPFVRIQRKHTEQGYNTSGRPFPFDEKDPLNYTHDLRLNQLGSIVVNGVEYYQFLLDINEPGNTKALLSLDDLQIYTSTEGSLRTRNLSQLGTLRYDLDAGGDHWILLDAARNSGSGSGDMLALIPTRLFAGAKATDFIYLYSQFGTHFESKSDDSEAGFEEWAVVAGPAGFPCPSATAQGGTITCEKPSVQITVTSDTTGATFKWTGPNGFTSTQQSPTVSAPGNYVVTVTGPSGCSATDTAIVVSKIQIPTVTATGGTLTCPQPTIQLKATSSAANSAFKWTGPGLVSGANTATPTVNAAGTYKVTVTDTNSGCSDSATALVVENKGQVNVSATGGELGEDGKLQLKAASTTSGVTFRWTGPGGFTSTQQNPIVTVTGNYTVTATSGDCSASATVAVTERPVAPSRLAVVCVGGNGQVGVPFSATVMATGGTPPYKFSIASGSLPAGLTLDSSSGKIAGTPTSAGNFSYSVKVTDSTGNTAVSGAQEAALPFSVPTGPLGTSQAYTLNGIPITAYGYTNVNTPAKLFGKKEGGNEDGLGLAGEVDDEVNSSNWIQLDLTQLIASGAKNATIMINSVQSGEGFEIYGSHVRGTIGTKLMSGGPQLDFTSFPIPNYPSYEFIGVRASAVNVLVGAIGATVGSDDCTLTIAPAANQDLQVTARGGQLSCSKPTVELTATASVSGATFRWTGPGGFTSTLQNPTVSVAGTYSVTATAPNGAKGTATATVTGSIDAPRVKATGGELTCASPSLRLEATASNVSKDVTFAWSGPGIVSGGSTPTPIVNKPGTYTVTVTDKNTGCTATATAVVTENKSQLTVSATNGKLPACPDRATTFPPLCDNFATFTQFTQGGWGSTPEGNNPGKLLAEKFASVYPTGFVIIGGRFTLKFTSASAIEAFLPQGSTPAALTASAVNPTNRITVLAGQVLALQLNIDFSAKGLTRAGLGELTLTSGNLAGQTVNAVAELANRVLGGDLSALPAGVSISELNEVVASINQNFDNCTTDNGNLKPASDANTSTASPSIQLTATASSQSVSFHWTGPGIVSGGENATVTVNKPGNYTVVATDKITGCSGSATAAVVQEQGTIVVGAAGGTITCAKPLVQLSASTSSSAPSFRWTGPGIVSGADTARPVVNAPGTYTVVVTDRICGASASASAVVSENKNPPTVTAVGGAITCAQSSVQLKATASKGEVTFRWAGPGILTGGETATPTVGAAGVYTVTVTDKETGCTATASATVTETTDRPTVTATGGVLTPANPTIQLRATASMAVNFSWTGPGIVAGANTATPTVNAPGVYTVKAVVAATGCEAVASAVVTAEKPSIAVTATGGVLTCAGPVINIHATTTATAPAFSWNGPGIIAGGNTSSPSVASPGNYTVVVTDTATGATGTAVAVVTENKGQVSASARGGELTCASPTVQVSATTSAAAPKFSWSGPGIVSGGNSASATVNLPGTYRVTVTDSTTGCSATAEARVTENKGQLTASATGGSLSASRPTIQLNATSSSNNAMFQWSGPGIVSGGDTATPTVNKTGTYVVTVTDKVTGCSVSAVALVTEERRITVSAVGGVLTCSSPVAQLLATASAPNATFQWSGPGIVSGGNSAAPVVNAAGTYTVAATDTASGLSATATAVVAELKTPPTVTATGGTLTCVQSSVQLSATVSKEGVSFNWTGPGIISGANTATPMAGAPGTYTVTVTDSATGCTATTTATVTESVARPSITASGGMLTPGNPTVQLNAIVSGAVNVNWSGPGILSGGNTTSPMVNLPGTYTVRVVDMNTGCEAVATALVTELKPVIVTVTATGGVLDCAHSVVSIGAATTVTTPAFNWSGPGILSGGNTATPTVALPGNYIVTVTDTASGSTGSAVAQVTENKGQVTANASGGQLTCANPMVQLSATTSASAPTFSWNGPGIVSGRETAAPSVNIPGTYTVTVTDSATGCSATASAVVTENKNQLSVNVTGGTLTPSQPSIQLIASTSSPDVTFHWMGPGIVSGGETATVTVNRVGKYVVTVTDRATGCAISAAAPVTEESEVTGAGITGGVITCASPTVQLAASASSPATFRWTGPGIVSGGDTATATVNAPGVYTVIITDTATGSSTSALAVVTENKSQPAVTAVGGVLTCAQPIIQLSASGSPGGVSFNWTGPGILAGANTSTPTVGSPGVYTVTVTDVGTGCIATTTTTVSEDVIRPSVTATGGVLSRANPTVTLNAVTTTAPAAFVWTGPGILSGANTARPIVDFAGTYTVRVTDLVSGCEAVTTAVVTEEAPRLAVIGTGGVLDCIDTVIKIRATTTASAPAFSWSGPGIVSGGNTAAPTVGVPGNYTVVVTDMVTGATGTAIAVVTENRPPLTANATGGVLDCIDTNAVLRVVTSAANPAFKWTGPGIVSGANTARPTVNVPGVYTVTVTDTLTGCFTTASALVRENQIPAFRPDLPAAPISFKLVEGKQTYFETTLLDVPPGYTVTNGTYAGWCIQYDIKIRPDTVYPATLHFCYGDDVPDYLRPFDWKKVNYILNHQHGATKQELQNAIWYFIGRPSGQPLVLNLVSQEIVNDALLNGDCYVPQPGDHVAVVVNTGQSANVQWNIIEITLPETSGVVVTGASAPNSRQFELTVQGPAGRTYAIEASTDLSNWTQVATVINTSGRISYTAENTSEFKTRFYRAVLIP
jgi:hypothetical protein